MTVDIYDAKKRRLRELELKQSAYGIDVSPQVATEIQDLQAELKDALLVPDLGTGALVPPARSDYLYDRLLARITKVEILAWVAAVGGGLFGLIDFVLLIQLSGRVH